MNTFAKRLIIVLLLVVFGEIAHSAINQVFDPVARTSLTLSAVNGGTFEYAAQRLYEDNRNLIAPVKLLIYFVGIYWAFLSFSLTSAPKNDSV